MCLDEVVLQDGVPLCAGVSGRSRRTCLKTAYHLRPMTDMMSGKPVREDASGTHTTLLLLSARTACNRCSRQSVIRCPSHRKLSIGLLDYYGTFLGN